MVRALACHVRGRGFKSRQLRHFLSRSAWLGRNTVVFQVLVIGVWRSLVARLSGGQEVVGSNPATPTRSCKKIENVPERGGATGATGLPKAGGKHRGPMLLGRNPGRNTRADLAPLTGVLRCGYGIGVVPQPSKLMRRVRIPLPAPRHHGDGFLVCLGAPRRGGPTSGGKTYGD